MMEVGLVTVERKRGTTTRSHVLILYLSNLVMASMEV
jgi:hypothetical protein